MQQLSTVPAESFPQLWLYTEFKKHYLHAGYLVDLACVCNIYGSNSAFFLQHSFETCAQTSHEISVLQLRGKWTTVQETQVGKEAKVSEGDVHWSLLLSG